jgi:hypothetical protein
MNEIEQLELILEQATPNSLVIFDVDEVLVYPTNIVQLQVASPFWEASMSDIEQRLGKDTRDMLHSIMLLQTQWDVTDKKIPKLIAALQMKKIQVLALTSFRRGKMGKIHSIEEWRNAQLKKYDIDFSISAGIAENCFEINPARNIVKQLNPVYKDGIIYTDLHSKSEVLCAFLEQASLKPKEIIFIDDRLSNVQDIENFCNTSSIKFIGIHDRRIMKKHTSFDENLGKYQFYYLEHFHIWLSDLEAIKHMANASINRLETVREQSKE